jgi:hypothetical protein
MSNIFKFVEIATYNTNHEFSYHLYKNWIDAQDKREDKRIASFTVDAHDASKLKSFDLAHTVQHDSEQERLAHDAIMQALKAQYTAQYVHSDLLEMMCENAERADLYNDRRTYACTDAAQAYVYAADTEIDY